jgi:hypothetical protein
MLKKVMFALVATALVAATALPLQLASAEAGTMTCKAAAKAKYPSNMKSRHAFLKSCKAHSKAQQKA